MDLSYGTVDLEMPLDGRSYTQTFLVANTCISTVSGILGIDFMEKNFATLNLRRRELCTEKGKVKLTKLKYVLALISNCVKTLLF